MTLRFLLNIVLFVQYDNVSFYAWEWSDAINIRASIPSKKKNILELVNAFSQNMVDQSMKKL